MSGTTEVNNQGSIPPFPGREVRHRKVRRLCTCARSPLWGCQPPRLTPQPVRSARPSPSFGVALALFRGQQPAESIPEEHWVQR